MQSELKPCPFCGSSEINIDPHPGAGRGVHYGETFYSIECYNCRGSVPARYSKELLISFWNRRANA